MAARAIWKGVIRLGEGAEAVTVPVKLYSGIEDRAIHFRLLHEKDRVPVVQRMVHGESGDPVASGEVRKGYEVAPGAFVTFEPEDLEALEPEASRDIEILRFVPAAAIDHAWYDRPYYLGPDGDDDAWSALAAALAKSGRVGVARWVMRKREYVGALQIEEGYPLLVTMRRPGEVVSPAELGAPGGRDLDARELEMAEQLVGALAEPFAPEDYADSYRRRVLELVEAKAKGKLLRLPKPAKRTATEDDLAGALEASLASIRERASA